MCHQWLSVIGLVLDLIGVVLVVAEWHLAFRQEFEERKAEIHAMMVRWMDKLEGRGEEADPDADSPLRQRGMWAGLKSNVRRRGGLVYVGIAFIVLGFLGQMFGSWPNGDPLFGLKSC